MSLVAGILLSRAEHVERRNQQMCGRFVLAGPGKALDRLFALAPLPAALPPPRYNIAPTQEVLAVRTHRTGTLEAWNPAWGLVPARAKDPAVASRLINARAETAATKPAFRGPFREQRCLVLADGFYEWKRPSRQPWVFRLTDDGPFAFASLWDRWIRPDGTPLETVSILTTKANELVEPVHDRMPLILHPADYDAWLDPSLQDASRLERLLRPFAATAMRAQPVGRVVNDVRHDAPDCLEPSEPEPSQPPLPGF